MKKLMAVMVAVMSIALISGCSKAPEDTAKAFMENLAKKDLAAAKEYATPQTGAMLDLMASMGMQDAIPDNANFEFTHVETTIDGDSAVVKFRTEPDGEVETMDLVKVDGDWKVSVKKDEPPDMGDAEPEMGME